MNNCPKCNSENIQQLGDNFFCLDCSWDDLELIEESKSFKPDDEIVIEGWHYPLIFSRALTNEEILTCYELAIDYSINDDEGDEIPSSYRGLNIEGCSDYVTFDDIHDHVS